MFAGEAEVCDAAVLAFCERGDEESDGCDGWDGWEGWRLRPEAGTPGGMTGVAACRCGD